MAIWSLKGYYIAFIRLQIFVAAEQEAQVSFSRCGCLFIIARGGVVTCSGGSEVYFPAVNGLFAFGATGLEKAGNVACSGNAGDVPIDSLLPLIFQHTTFGFCQHALHSLFSIGFLCGV